jgi:hypothetical protein
MHRPTVGILALALLAGAAAIYLGLPGDEWYAAMAGMFRMGLVLAALWLAEPQLRRLPGWAIFGVVAVMVVLALRPRLFLLAVIVLIVAAILRPRQRPKPKRPGGRE